MRTQQQNRLRIGKILTHFGRSGSVSCLLSLREKFHWSIGNLNFTGDRESLRKVADSER